MAGGYYAPYANELIYSI